MDVSQEFAWKLTHSASQICKSLLWMQDTELPRQLTEQLVQPLSDGLTAIAELPDALSALEEKMRTTYQLALDKPSVGVGTSPFTQRRGKRTSQLGLRCALSAGFR